MNAPSVDLLVQVRRREDGAGGASGTLLARERVDPAYLRILAEEVIWNARRQGKLGDDPSCFWWEVEPRFVADGERRRVLEGVDLRVGDSGSRSEPALEQRFSLLAFEEPAQAVVRRLVEDSVLSRGDRYQVDIAAAHLPRPVSSPRFQVVSRSSAPPAMPGSLEAWRERATTLNGEVRSEGDTEVFALGSVLEQARFYCRRPGRREGGAALVGEVRRQWKPRPELFVVIHACLEMRHAERTSHSLEPTADTYRQLEEQLARRRRRLERPSEQLVGVAHGHNFAPSLDGEGRAVCPTCPEQPDCGLHSAFYSADDIRFHRAVFTRQPFALGLVWGLSPRDEDVLRVYGFRDGAVRERSISLVEDPPEEGVIP